MEWLICLFYFIKDAFVTFALFAVAYYTKETTPFWCTFVFFAAISAQLAITACEFIFSVLEISADIRYRLYNKSKKKWVEEYERTHCGGIVQTDKSAIRELKGDDCLHMNSGEAVIDEEKIRRFFNNK